jgi:hypothetical protein
MLHLLRPSCAAPVSNLHVAVFLPEMNGKASFAGNDTGSHIFLHTFDDNVI